MKTYTILRCEGEPDWESIPALRIDQEIAIRDTGVRAEGRLCHDDGNLYVRMRAFEDDVRAEHTELFSRVYEDSCLEFFFMPDGEENYFNFEINPNGCMLLQFGREDRVDLVKRGEKEYFGIAPRRTADGWELSYRIPLAFIRLFYPDFRFDRDLRANMYKCGNKTAVMHFLAWSAEGMERPDFHATECFGRMIFE